MKRLLLAFALIYVSGTSVLNAQCSSSSLPEKRKFTGVAPSPWAINGQVNDWQTILGPATGNNQSPYNPPVVNRFNYSKEPASIPPTDLDNPDPSTDIRFAAFIHDDYNVYFYLRRLENSNPPNSFYYFCDINADGFMNDGEPVFGCRFNKNNIIELSVNSYIPNQNVDYVAGKGNRMMSPGTFFVDGYTIKGTAQKIFQNNAIPSAYALGANEVFNAAVTENGFGVELSIPWKYFRNWVTLSSPLTPDMIFTYHLAMKKGPVPGYNPQLVDDNFGNCCKKLLVSGNATFDIISQNISTLTPGKSYELHMTLKNTTNVPAAFGLGRVLFENLHLNPQPPSMPADPFLVLTKVNGVYEDPFMLDPDFPGNPWFYTSVSGLTYTEIVGPNGTINFSVKFSLNSAEIITSLKVTLLFVNELSLPIFCSNVCPTCAPTGSGDRPVIFEVTTENGRQQNTSNNKPSDKPEPTDNLINFLKVYPNPSSGSATVILPGTSMNGELRLENISGNLVYRKLNTTGPAITLQNLRPGFYLLKYTDGHSGKQYVEKLVVQ